MKHPSLILLYIPLVFAPWLSSIFIIPFEYYYLAIIGINIILLMDMKDRKKYLLSPSFIVTFYLYISFYIGEVVFSRGIVQIDDQASYYAAWKYHLSNTVYYNVCTFLSFISYLLVENKKDKVRQVGRGNIMPTSLSFKILIFILLTIVLLLPISAIGFFIPIFGILFITQLYHSRPYVRFIGYVFLIGYMAFLNPDNKRESIFLFYPIVTLELTRILYVKFKSILYLFGGIVLLVGAILVMSIIRAGLGSDFIEILSYIPVYLSSDNAITMIVDNFEINYVYINSFQALEFINNDTHLLNFGISYFKPLLILIPSAIIDKPMATMLQYTKEFDPWGADAGLSLPITISAEAYWNFMYVGTVVVFIIFLFLNKMYIRCYSNFISLSNSLLRSIPFSTIYSAYFLVITLFLIRGCGFDLFFIYAVIGWLTILSFRFILNVFK